MAVDLEPAGQLSFHRPFTQLVSEILTISNNTSDPVAFKVKTTAPKQYCVRPNSGRIEPNQKVEVKVILQPMKEDPPLDFKCKDKFLVQSVMITPDRESLSLSDLWAKIDLENKEMVKEHKIRCVYLPPITQNILQPILPPELPSTHKNTQNFIQTSSGVPDVRTIPVDNVSYSTYQADSEASTITERPASEQRPTPVSVANGHNSTVPQTPSLIGSFPRDFRGPDHQSVPSYSSGASYNDEDETSRLRRQLHEAQEEIKRLKNNIEGYKQELNTAQMRQRKIDEGSEKHGAGHVRVQEKIPEGYYPLEISVAAAVVAFVLGVMFF